MGSHATIVGHLLKVIKFCKAFFFYFIFCIFIFTKQYHNAGLDIHEYQKMHLNFWSLNNFVTLMTCKDPFDNHLGFIFSTWKLCLFFTIP